MNKRDIGNEGEKIALDYLLNKGYESIKQNFYTRWGEIDLIVFDSKSRELVFVEVKTRSSNSFGNRRYCSFYYYFSEFTVTKKADINTAI